MSQRSGADDLEAQAEKKALKSAQVGQSYASTGESHAAEQSDESGCFEDSDEVDDEEVQTHGDGRDIVQFSAPIYYATEEKNFVRVEAIRLGSHKGVVSAVLTTREGTARPGINYTTTQTELVFGNGQGMKTVDIPIIEDGTWTPASEFSVILDKPEHCGLGMNLYVARVKILNEDPFPSQAYKNVVKEDGTMKEVDLWTLYWHYIWLNFKRGGVGKQSIIIVCLDQLTNVCLFLQLCVAVYMVDVLFERGVETRQHLMTKDRYNDAILIGLWYFIPVLILFLRDVYKAHLNIEGNTEASLRKWMMKSFLNYSAMSRRTIGSSEISIAVSDNAAYIARGYCAGVSTVQSLGKIFIVFLFMLLYQPQYQVIFMLALQPILLLLFTVARLGPALRAEEIVDSKITELVKLTQEASSKFRLIADYFKRPVMADMFAVAADEHKESMELQTFVHVATENITKVITGFFICAYIILNAQFVLDGQLSLGLFLATISVFGIYMADAIMELNTNLRVIMESFLSLQQATLQFNLPSDHRELKKLSERRRRETLKERKRLKSFHGSHGATDKLEIRLKNVCFEHVDTRDYLTYPKILNVNASAKQGTMIAVMGVHCSGKKLFMEIIADANLPTKGHVFVPSHLRLLHVSREPMFMFTSLLHNLTLGVPSHQDVDVERVKTILRLMDLPHLPDEVEREKVELQAWTPRTTKGKWTNVSRHDTDWQVMFSHSQLMKLHLCRALIADPNVMVLQRPLHHFNEEVANAVLKVLRTHIDSRGLGHAGDTKSMQSRRPRTIFLIPESLSQANAADAIWTMNPKSKSVDVSAPTAPWSMF